MTPAMDRFARDHETFAGNGGGTGAVVLKSANLTDAVTVADGSAATKSDGTGVGVGVAVSVARCPSRSTTIVTGWPIFTASRA